MRNFPPVLFHIWLIRWVQIGETSGLVQKIGAICVPLKTPLPKILYPWYTID
jgi:hypothetical protein